MIVRREASITVTEGGLRTGVGKLCIDVGELLGGGTQGKFRWSSSR